MPAAEFHADRAVAGKRAGAGEHQVAQTGKAGQRLPASPASYRKPGDLRHAAGDDGRGAVVPQPQPGGDAGGDRDDILKRTAQLDADHVIIGIEPQSGRGELLLQPAG